LEDVMEIFLSIIDIPRVTGLSFSKQEVRMNRREKTVSRNFFIRRNDTNLKLH
jgi:hypothetical protein